VGAGKSVWRPALAVCLGRDIVHNDITLQPTYVTRVDRATQLKAAYDSPGLLLHSRFQIGNLVGDRRSFFASRTWGSAWRTFSSP
jgi:hypothetical protein